MLPIVSGLPEVGLEKVREGEEGAVDSFAMVCSDEVPTATLPRAISTVSSPDVVLLTNHI
jgi:hypothetical protein